MNLVWRNRWGAGLFWLAAVCPAPALLAAARPVRAEAAGAVASAQAIPFTRAEVESRDGQRVAVAWSAAGGGPVDVYARTTPAGPDPQARLVGHGGANGQITVAGLPVGERWYFELRPRRGGSLIIADRSLHLKTAPNFRDVGGYRTRDGHWVRMGLAYRSDQLDRLNDADLAVIARLAPTLIVDLRTQGERRAADRLAPGAAPMIADVLADQPVNNSAFSKLDSPEAGVKALTEANRMFVSLPSAKDAYSRLFTRLQSPDVAVYHCTSGKDRTGWATAVLLTALGVPREAVIADYLASNGYLVEKNRAMFAALPPATAANLEPVMTVRAAYLEAAFAEVDKRYGSFDRYLREGLGLDRAALERLRAKFLAG